MWSSLSAMLPEDRRLVAADHPETTGSAGLPVGPYFHDVKQPNFCIGHNVQIDVNCFLL
jgi:hypothetical protein